VKNRELGGLRMRDIATMAPTFPDSPGRRAHPGRELDPYQRIVEWPNTYEFAGWGRDFHCRGHDDHNPSLSVSRATRSRNAAVVLKCFAGCSTQRILDAMNAIDSTYRWTLAELSGSGTANCRFLTLRRSRPRTREESYPWCLSCSKCDRVQARRYAGSLRTSPRCAGFI
jgi:hypothetical protein